MRKSFLKFIFPLLFLISFVINAQETYEFYIKDSNGYPIAFANAYINGRSINYSNENGYLKIPNIKQGDTLSLSSVGFKGWKKKVSEVSKEIILEKEIIQLNEVVILNGKSVWLGYSNQGNTISSHTEVNSKIQEFGIIIQNKNSLNGYISKIKVKAGFTGKPKLPIRINIYSIGEDGYPKNNILQNQIVFIPKSKKLKWHEFDIENQHIQFPENGVCLTLEFINPSPETYVISDKFHPSWMGFFNPNYKSISKFDTQKWLFSKRSSLAAGIEIKTFNL